MTDPEELSAKVLKQDQRIAVLAAQNEYFRCELDRHEREARDCDQKVRQLEEQNADLREEKERYQREARDGAQVIGGILRVLRDNGVGSSLSWSWR